MPSVEELLSQDSEDETNLETYADGGIEYCTVDDDTRLVTIPDKYKKLGVESDEKVKRIWFRFPKLVGNNGVDLSKIGVRVNFRNANGDGDIYIVEDLTTDGDYVTFSWELTRKVTAYKGNVSFVVCAVKSATNGTIKNEWNTTLNKECEVLEGLEVTEQITQENPDIIEYILANLGGSVSAEQIAQAVESYLVENPPSGMTAEEKAQLNKNTEDISSLSEEIANKTGTGLSTEAIDKLEEVGNYLAYTTADGGSKWTELIAILRNGSSGGGSGETVTLQSISATYTGGDVAVGTALTDLTGITVTAHYSDGSTANVTGYTLSGTIAEGENTITVSYNGLTDTFTVTGVAESSGIVNLFDKDTMVIDKAFVQPNGMVYENIAGWAYAVIPVDSNTTYTLQKGISNSFESGKWGSLTFLNANNDILQLLNSNAGNQNITHEFKADYNGNDKGAVTFLTPENCTSIRFTVTSGSGGDALNTTMLEIGDTCHEYVPHV